MDAFVVIAKEPRGGSAKTRLRPLLGNDGAAEIAEAMLLDTLAAIAASAPANARLVLFHTQPEAAARLRELDPVGSFELVPQPPGNLGQRLDHITRLLFREGCHRVVVVAADAPHMAATATDLLPSSPREVVLGPTADGGYWAVGLGSPAPIFDVPMGGTDVLDATICCARGLGRSVRLLAESIDVDTPDDLAALAADGSLTRTPRTAAAWQAVCAAQQR